MSHFTLLTDTLREGRGPGLWQPDGEPAPPEAELGQQGAAHGSREAHPQFDTSLPEMSATVVAQSAHLGVGGAARTGFLGQGGSR